VNDRKANKYMRYHIKTECWTIEECLAVPGRCVYEENRHFKTHEELNNLNLYTGFQEKMYNTYGLYNPFPRDFALQKLKWREVNGKVYNKTIKDNGNTKERLF